jgi:transposase-like protein
MFCRKTCLPPSSSLTIKMNAVRAAFKVGVKPSQIARQFGLSRSDVRKARAEAMAA